MGVDSGLPDFRGTEGFWNAYPPYRHLGLSFAQMANPAWFERDPPFAWGFYGHRLNLYRRTLPHAGFGILLKWAARMPAGARVFTSNVDGQFQKAGFTDETVTEVHGSIHHLQCSETCTDIWSAGGMDVSVNETTFRAEGTLPRCPHCAALARPNILMFGNDCWLSHRTDAQERALNAWLLTVHSKRLVVVEMGAGTAIPTVRHFSNHAASRDNATLIRINMREPDAPRGHVGIPGGALETLRTLDSLLGW